MPCGCTATVALHPSDRVTERTTPPKARPMQRRRFQHTLLVTAGMGLCVWMAPAQAQTALPAHVWLPGLQSLVEMMSRRAMERWRGGLWPALHQHARQTWSNWTRYGTPKLRDDSLWSRWEAFDSLTRYTARRMWELARDSLMLQAFTLTDTHVARVRLRDAWVTDVFERHAADRLRHRLLGDVVELQLAWLLENRDRYPRNPAARHAQIEAEDWEMCLRATRAVVYAIFDAIAAEERDMRQSPKATGTPAQVSAVLSALGPAPSAAYQPERHAGGGPWEEPIYINDLPR